MAARGAAPATCAAPPSPVWPSPDRVPSSSALSWATGDLRPRLAAAVRSYSPAMRDVVLFDLDDTLVVEEPAAVAAFDAVARRAAAECGVDAAALALAARARARELWHQTPAHAYCLRVGISSWEGLWCRFEGDEPNMRWLREWSPAYRHAAWARALADQGVQDRELADELGRSFASERRARHAVFADVGPALAALGSGCRLGVVTNGASCLQREKLSASGVGEAFSVTVVSADVGAAKPDAAPFRQALAALGCEGRHAVMVGDSLSRDVAGATAAGIGAVWINRDGRDRPDGHDHVCEITTLADLPAALADPGA